MPGKQAFPAPLHVRVATPRTIQRLGRASKVTGDGAAHDRAPLGPPLRRAAFRAGPDGARDRRDQRAEARHRRLLRRPDDLRLQGGVRAGEALSRPDRVRGARRRARQPRLAQRRLRALRGAVRRAQLGPAHAAASRSSRSTRPSPTSTTARSAAAATAGSRSSSPPSRPSFESSSSTITCCRFPAPAASGTSSTTPATRSSACSAPVRISCSPATSTCRTRGSSRTCSSSTPAPSRRCASAATRGPVTTSIEVERIARHRLAPLPVPRAGADHPVRPRDRRVREVHRPDRARGDREAMKRRSLDRRRALRAGRARRARGAAVRVGRRDPRRRHREAARAAPTTACRSSTTSPDAEVVVDLSDEPVLGPRRALPLGLARARGRTAVRRRRLPLRSAGASSRSSCPRSR